MFAASEIALLERVVDRVDTGILILDRQMNIQLWNQFMVTHSQRSTEEVVGRNLFECFPELPQVWFQRKINGVLILKNQAFTSWQQRPYLFRFSHNRHVTGGVDHMYQDCTLTPLLDDDGEVTAICISVKDVTEVSIYETRLKEALAQVEIASHTDGLTRLFNRAHWEDRFREEVDRIQRYGGKLSLLMFDLDHFKVINDTYGHQAGDEVLRQVSGRVNQVLRKMDVAGRYGGEEFCIYLPSTDLSGAEKLAERVRKVMACTPVAHEGREIDISISLGVTEFADPDQNHERLIKEADEALYYAKKNGRNRFACFSHLPR